MLIGRRSPCKENRRGQHDARRLSVVEKCSPEERQFMLRRLHGAAAGMKRRPEKPPQAEDQQNDNAAEQRDEKTPRGELRRLCCERRAEWIFGYDLMDSSLLLRLVASGVGQSRHQLNLVCAHRNHEFFGSVPALRLVVLREELPKARDLDAHRSVDFGFKVRAAAESFDGDGVFAHLPVSVFPEIDEETAQR